MTEDLYHNTKEHEVLKPRTREQWDHSKFYCDICWPEEFRALRSGGIYADMFMRNHPATQFNLDKLRAMSIKDKETA